MHFMSPGFLRICMLLLALFCEVLALGSPPTRPYWPSFDWKQGSRPDTSMNQSACQSFQEYAFGSSNDSAAKESADSKNRGTHAVVVIKNGLLQFEQYAFSYTRETPHSLWSLSQSITATIVGSAVQSRHVTLGEHIANYYPVTQSDGNEPKSAYSSLTLTDLVDKAPRLAGKSVAQPGLDSFMTSSLINFEAWQDRSAYAAKKIMQQVSSKEQEVGRGVKADILMGILNKVFQHEYESMPWSLLFDPLKMRNAVIERDGAGNFIGSSYVYLRPLDIAKLGFLYMNDGVWNGRRLLPEQWGERVFDLTASATSVYGSYGQVLALVPAEDLIVVRTAHDDDFESFDLEQWLEKARACFKS